MSDPYGGAQPSASSTRVWPAVVGAIGMAVVLAVVAFLLIRSLGQDSDSVMGPTVDEGAVDEVQLEPVTYRSPSPFTESVVTMDDDELALLAAGARTDLSGPVRGDTSLLYGTRGSRPTCDVARLAAMLTDDPSVTAAWAAAAGVEPGAVHRTVTSMTPVVLTSDTAVTNHVYGPNETRSYQAVLQAGTAVLIDDHGTPRTQCSCGNPLLPPQRAEDAGYLGDEWDEFDRDRVVEVAPADRMDVVETVDLDTKDATETRLGPVAMLDGLLATTDEGVHVIDPEAGSATRVLDHAVSAVFDDGLGGLVFTRRRSDIAPSEFEQQPPATRDDAVIWHLPAGTTEARELVGVEPNHWNRLLGVGQLGGRTYVVFSPLHTDSEVLNAPTATGPIEVQDLDSGERIQLLEHGFGWEVSTGGVSFGGDRLSMEIGYSMPDWVVLGPDLQPLAHVCVATNADSSEEVDIIDRTCPWRGTLDEQGHLNYFASMLSDGAGEQVDDSVEALDLQAGAVVERHPLATGASTAESYLDPVQIRDGLLTATFTINNEPATREGVVIALDSGQQVDLSSSNLSRIRSVRVLTAPLLRPEASADQGADAGTPTASETPKELDLMNMTLPGGTCTTYAGFPSPPIQLSNGEGRTGGDQSAPEYVGVSFEPEETTRLDVDADGTDEHIVSVRCHWGGSGYSTNVVALAAGPDGAARLIGAALDEYGHGSATAERLSVGAPGVLTISGHEWLDGDIMCCPSSEFTAHWRMRDGVWEEVGS